MKALRASALAALLSCADFDAGPVVPTRVRVEPYLNVDPCLVMEAPTPRVTAIAMPSEGGRIVSYSLGGENIFHQPADPAGTLLPGGGYQCDVGPEPRTVPRPHPTLWSGKYGWGKLGSSVIALASEPCPVLGVKLDRQVTIDARTGSLSVVQRMKNVSGQVQAFCLWDRTLCKSGGFTLLPLPSKSRFPARWALGRRNARKLWDYDGTTPVQENCRVMDGVLVVKAEGKDQKVGTDSDAGWIAYARGRLLFVKYFPVDPAGTYSDGGLTVAHYFNSVTSSIAELEPISPEVRLPPGGEYIFPEKWTLTRLPQEVTTFEDARELVDSIPPSPFKK